LDPPKSLRNSKIGAFVGRQLEAAIFSQLEESTVDSDTEDTDRETCNEAKKTAESEAGELQGRMMTEVHSQQTNMEDNNCMQMTSMDVVQEGSMSNTSFVQTRLHPVVSPDKQPETDMTDTSMNQNIEFYFSQVQTLPAVSVTTDWIPSPKQAVLMNCVSEVEITRTVLNVLLLAPQPCERPVTSQSTMTMPFTESETQSNSMSHISDTNEVKKWARDAQVNENWLKQSHDSGRLIDNGFMNPSTPLSPLDKAGETKDANRQAINAKMAQIDSGVITSAITSDAITKTDDLPSSVHMVDLPSAHCMTTVDDQGSDNSGDSSMKNSIGVERKDDSSDIKDSGLHSWVDRTEELGHHQAQMQRTGWLVVKTVLVQKNGKVAEAGKQKWKKYWATLVDTNLLMYQCDNVEQLTGNIQPTACIGVNGALAQPSHEYLKKDFVFCLTITSGYAFYLQAINQADTDNWIRAIHCVAAVAAVECSDLQRVPKALKSWIQKLEEDSESEMKMKKLAELQLSTATKPDVKSKISSQIKAWMKNVEWINVDLYRLKCYLSAIQETELPNPQMALANVSKATRVALGRLHQGFTVSSLYAIVNCKFSEDEFC
jgi:hypothetical protein